MANDMSEQKVILCVDDEEDILELFRDEFNDVGYKVLEARTGNQALDLFKKEKIDCLISDIRMPDGDGVTLIRNISTMKKGTPVFLVTGYSDYTSEDLSGLGINAVVFKPFDLYEVVQMVKRSLGD